MSGRLIVVAAGILSCGAILLARQGHDAAAQGRTTKDGVYASAQADRGQATFEKLCSKCHGFAPWEKSDLNPDLAGAAFLEKWNGRPVLDVMTIIYTSMPNDGSAFLTEEQTADLTAYILKRNGFPAGEQPLAAGEAARQITIVK